jgi:hypothetical protein
MVDAVLGNGVVDAGLWDPRTIREPTWITSQPVGFSGVFFFDVQLS